MKVADTNPANRRKSNYESFELLEGVLRVTQTYPLPSPRARYGKSEFELVCSYNMTANNSYVAVRVTYTDPDDHVSMSVLDGDELQVLRQGLAYLTSNRNQLRQTATVYTEIDFVSRAGFKVGIYCSPGGELGEYMFVDGESVFLHSLDDLLRCMDVALEKLRHVDRPFAPPLQP